MVTGGPGAGKTILGNQFCFSHVARGEHAVYVTLLAESHGPPGPREGVREFESAGMQAVGVAQRAE